jgi:hypothetical protein
LIYHGATIGLDIHLCKMKYSPPPKINIVDFTMDVLSGFVIKDSRNEVTSVDQLVKSLEGWWRTTMSSGHQQFMDTEKTAIHAFYGRMKVLHKLASRGEDDDVASLDASQSTIQPKGLWQVFCVSMSRQFKVSNANIAVICSLMK